MQLTVTITDTSLTVARRQDQIDVEAALDGFCVPMLAEPITQRDAFDLIGAPIPLTIK